MKNRLWLPAASFAIGLLIGASVVWLNDTRYSGSDLNHDGVVDALDLSTLLSNYNSTKQ